MTYFEQVLLGFVAIHKISRFKKEGKLLDDKEKYKMIMYKEFGKVVFEEGRHTNES